MATEQGIQEMITLLEGYVQQFYPPALAPLTWRAPKTVKVRGLDVTKAELTEMLSGYKKQLSELKTSGSASEITSGTTQTTLPETTQNTAPASSVAPQSSGMPLDEQLAEYEYWINEYTKATSTVESALKKISTGGTISVDGKQYSQRDGVALLDDLRTKLKSWQKLAKPIQESRKSQENKARNSVYVPGTGDMIEFWQKRFDQSQSQKDYDTLQGFIKTYNDAKPKPLPTFKPTKVAKIADLASITPSATTTTAAAPGRVLTAAESKALGQGLAPTEEPPVITDTTKIPQKIVTPKVTVSEDKIVSQLELRGLTDTPENRKTIRQELVKQPGLSSDWKERFIAEYPQYAQYLTDPMYGDDVTQVFQRAMEEQWFKYGEIGLSVFARELGKTAYGLKTNSTQKMFDAKSVTDQNESISDQLDFIRSTYGNFGQNGDTPGLSDQELFNLARESARNGYTNEQQKRAIYTYIYNADPTADRTAVISRVEAGRIGQDVNKIYNDYLLAPDKSAIKRYATGEITLEDVKREARALTSQMYPALKSLIDQGVSVKAISDQYAATAGNILEQDETTINMADTKYRVAFSSKDAAGNPSLMSLGEWQTMLKTNADFGWQYTKAANSQALDTATMIARTFGKVQ